MGLLKQSTVYTRTFKMISSTDHISLKTGAAPVVNLSKAGGSFGGAAGTVSEIANGWYKVALTTGDTGTLGDLSYYITGTGADDTDFLDQIVANILGDILPANVTQWNSQNVATPITNGVPVVDWLPSGWRQSTAQAGAAGSITLDASASATNDFYKYALIMLIGATGAGQARLCTTYNGGTKVATIVPNWTTNPDVTSKFVVMPIGLADVETWLASAVTAAASGIPDVNVKNINNISGSGITTIKAVQGLTTADTIATYTGDTPQTGDAFARIGATGSGLTTITALLPTALTANGNMKSSLVEILTTALTETVGQLAGGFKKFFNIATPAATMDHGVLVDTATTATTATNLTNAPTNGDFTATMKTSIGTAVAASAVASVTAGVTLASGAITDASIAAGSGLKSIRSNTAQAGAGTTITLDASASASNSFYNNTLILLTGGTGAGQARFITAYVGATKVATVATWTTNPDNTTTFAILPFDAVAGASAPTVAQIATGLWQDLLSSSDFSTAGSIGALLKLDIDAAISSRMATFTLPANFSSLSISAAGKINEVVLVDTLTTYTGDTPQTGDAFARIGVAGAGLTALGDVRVAHLDADVSSRTKPADTQARVTLVDTLTTYTGNTPQTGDSYVATVIRKATAQGGSTTSMTLDAGASAVDSFYNNMWILILSGSGAGQCRPINTYTGASKVATVSNLVTAADNTSVFAILPGATFSADDVTTIDTEVGGQIQNLIALDGSGRVTLIPAYDSAKTSAQATTALSTATWTNARAAFLDNLNALKIKKNTALANFPFLMVESVDHVTPATGLTVTAQRKIDNGAFAACANSVTEVSNGIYVINLAASDLNGDVITLLFTAASADQRPIVIFTEP